MLYENHENKKKNDYIKDLSNLIELRAKARGNAKEKLNIYKTMDKKTGKSPAIERHSSQPIDIKESPIDHPFIKFQEGHARDRLIY